MTTKTLIEVDVPEGANILHVAMDFYGDLHQVGFRLVPPARAVPDEVINALKFYADESEWSGRPWKLLFNSSRRDGHGFELAKHALETLAPPAEPVRAVGDERDAMAADFRRQLAELSQRNYSIRFENSRLRASQPASSVDGALSVPRDVFDEVLLLVSTLTDPKAKTPGRTDAARELLPKLRALLHSVVMPATCESNGHIFGHGAQCVFCGTDKKEHADHAES